MNFEACNVLISGEGELQSKARYVLARWVQDFGVGGEVSIGVKELALRYGVSAAHISNSLKAMVVAEILAKRSVPRGRGRPKGCYEVRSKYAEKLRSTDVLGVRHQAAIGLLLRQKDRVLDFPAIDGVSPSLASMWAARKPNQLDIESRLLLAVLLCHADRLGVVRDQGQQQLLRQTGMDTDQLKHRIRLLIKLGWIRAYLPGTNDVSLFGYSKSTYFINLQHPELFPSQSVAVLLHIESCLHSDGDIASSLVKGVDYASERRAMGMENLSLVQEQQLSRLLRSKLERYASFYLTHYWGFSTGGAYREDMLDLIKNDLRKIPDPDGDKEQLYVEDTRTRLAHVIHELAYTVATNVRSSLIRAKFSSIELEGMTYAILPSATNAPCFSVVAVLAAPSEGGAELMGYHVAVSSGNETQHQHHASPPVEVLGYENLQSILKQCSCDISWEKELQSFFTGPANPLDEPEGCNHEKVNP